MAPDSNSVLVVVAAYRRPGLLHQLLASLQDAGPALEGALVVDNADDPDTRTVCEDAPVPTRYSCPGTNLGCGGGLQLALREGLKDPGTTHFWILDDDAKATPGALTALLDGMNEAQADVAVPLVTNTGNRIGWFPGLTDRQAFDTIRTPRQTVAGYRKACGLEPRPFTWAPWPSLLVSRRAVETAGFPRDDFWFQGEDLEYSLRLTARFKGVLVPGAVCEHLPPAKKDDPLDQHKGYLKTCLMLQNTSYAFVRLPHGHRARKHLPGNYWRFFKAHGWKPRCLIDATRAFVLGALVGKPADNPAANHFKQRWLRLTPP